MPDNGNLYFRYGRGDIMPSISLHNGDCLEVMRSIPYGSIDAIITDPPYGTTACKWDSVIPFEPMWAELKRIIKPNGAIVLFGSQPFTSALIMSNIKMFKYELVWVKSNKTGHLNGKCRPLKSHELISVFSKAEARAGGKNMNYNPQGLIEINKAIVEKRNDKGIRHNYFRESINEKEYIQKFTNYPDALLSFAQDKNKIHPTQKPIALLEYLIKTYTNENETVLDFTMGSGTTGHAAVNLNRSFIGIELDKGYFDIAKKRIETAQRDLINQFGDVA